MSELFLDKVDANIIQAHGLCPIFFLTKSMLKVSMPMDYVRTFWIKSMHVITVNYLSTMDILQRNFDYKYTRMHISMDNSVGCNESQRNLIIFPEQFSESHRHSTTLKYRKQQHPGWCTFDT